MSRWRKFRALSWPDIGFLLFASGALAGVALLLRIAGFRRSVAWLRRSSRGAGTREPTPAALEWARRRATLIATAARFGPYRASCLRRALLLWWWLRRRGLDPRLRIGVRRHPIEAPEPGIRAEAGEFLAHAWTELAGEVLDDRADIGQTYAAFDAQGLPKRVSWS